MTIEELIKKIKNYNPKSDTDLIRRAYEIAAEIHKNERRSSGEPYIVHPLEVASILADFKVDDASICAALLHDVVETSSASMKILKEEFGEEIVTLVDGLTKITELKSKGRDVYQSESIRKMLFATTKDIRVLIIKLADKLHNMRTLDYLPKEKQQRIAQEAMDVYAPLAYRLGIERIRSQIEDLAFKVLEPKEYKDIDEKIKRNKKARDEEMLKIKRFLERALSEGGIDAEVSGRIKTHYSIYKKMLRKNRTFEAIFDVIGLRVITKTTDDCYKVLGVVHNMWKPIPRRFKDFIAMPKVNMYQSLHDVVIGPEGTIVEIQIRTDEMDRFAEEGIAAHWQYKGMGTDRTFDKKLSWLKQIMEWQQETKTGKEFVESLEIDFFGDEIYVFTPKGDVIELPKSSTPLDFAYAIHSDLGDHCSGAKINGTFGNLRHELRTGDVIEIITSKTQKPSRGWLSIVKTAKAKNKIRKYLMEKGSIPLARGGRGTPAEEAEAATMKSIVVVEGQKNPKLKLSRCCDPLPGDNIVGYLTKSNTVSIHKKDCDKIGQLEEGREKKVKVKWKMDFSSVAELNVDARDRVGLLADVLNTISATGTNIERANVKVVGGDMAECSFILKFEDLEHMNDLIGRIKKVKDVKKIWIGKLGEEIVKKKKSRK